MIKIDIEYICDKCGKSKKEKTIKVKGYEEVIYAIEDEDRDPMPKGWSTDFKTLYCTKCEEK